MDYDGDLEPDTVQRRMVGGTPWWWMAVSMASLSCGPPRYFTPELPPDQLVAVTVDDHAEVELIDGYRLVRHDGQSGPVKEFRVSTGCHHLTARYAQSFVWPADDPPKDSEGMDLKNLGLKQTRYRTEEPIQFHVLAKQRRTYWVTATFTGDVFLPRVSEIDVSSGEAVAAILPDTPCP